MTLAAAVALVEALLKTVSGLTDLVASHTKRIEELETKVQLHDSQLKTPPAPGLN